MICGLTWSLLLLLLTLRIDSSSSSLYSPALRERLSRLGHRLSGEEEGATGILVDLGANCGNSYWSFRELFEKQKRPENFTYYLFEPNPKLLEQYLHKLAAEEKNVKVVEAAGWIEDGSLSFYLDSNTAAKACDPHSNKNPQGASSLFQDEFHPRSGERISVQSVDMNRWLQQHVRPSDYCVLKVDIEGAEYELLRHLAVGGSLQLVDELYVEFHEPYTHKAALQWLAEAYPFHTIQGWH